MRGARGLERVGEVLPHVTAVREVEARALGERPRLEDAGRDVETEVLAPVGREVRVRFDAVGVPALVAQEDERATDAGADVEGLAGRSPKGGLVEAPRERGLRPAQRVLDVVVGDAAAALVVLAAEVHALDGVVTRPR